MEIDKKDIIFEVNKGKEEPKSTLYFKDGKHYLLIELPMLDNNDGEYYSRPNEEAAISHIQEVMEILNENTDEANHEKNQDYMMDNMGDPLDEITQEEK